MIRFFDFVFSFVGLLLFLPLFILLAICIKLDSNGSIFYRQERVGKNGISFKLIKFRSMSEGADKKGLLTVGAKDNRVTKMGYWLRKYKLDELPQLINVMKGEMSIVGPRPEVRKFVNLYTNEQKMVLSVKPGITDYASIYYRNENTILADADDPEQAYITVIIPHKIELNMRFIKAPTFKNYCRIVFLTIIKIF